MRLFLAIALLPGLAGAIGLPESIGRHPRVSYQKVVPRSTDVAILEELGLKNTDTAQYSNLPAPFELSVQQFPNSTAALAAFYWQRPASSNPSRAAPLAAETPDSLLLAHGDYLLRFGGYKPSKPELDAVLKSLPQGAASLPALYLPHPGRVLNSERYITGPSALQAFLPGIPLHAANFDLGAEVQSAVFHSPKGDVTLAVFSYPTPQIAMKQAHEFVAAGLGVRRSLSLVAVALPTPADPSFVENLLSQVRYQADVTIPEHIPTLLDNPGNLVLNIFILIGIVLLITLGGGAITGLMRAYQRRGGRDPDANTVITLHLK